MRIVIGNWCCRVIVFVLLFSFGLATGQVVDAQSIPAFPGAEGWGAVSVGGRGGRVIEVTNLNDAGTGSLRDCIGASGPRICVFRVAGEIVLTSGRLAVRNPFLTIAGQTAPGDGITVRAGNTLVRPIMNFESNVHNVIVRYIKFRLGFNTSDHPDKIGPYPSEAREERDVITIRSGQNIILDHISAQWGTDEGVSANPDPGAVVKDITIQRCIVAAGLRPHSTGSLFRSEPSQGRDTSRVSLHHCLYSHNAHRNPRFDSVDQIQAINNVMYNWFSRSGETVGATAPDFIANYFKAGPWSDPNRIMQHEDTPGPTDPTLFPDPSIYAKDNIAIPFQPDPNAANWNLFRYAWIKSGLLPTSWRRFTPHPSPPIPVTITSAQQAYNSVLADVGDNARLDSQGNWVSRADAVDSRMINNVKNGTGPTSPEQNDHQNDHGGFPSINPGTPYADTDHDGMADGWENLHFATLSRGFPSDSSSDFDGDGYTDLEEFLNGNDPGSGAPTPTPTPTPVACTKEAKICPDGSAVGRTGPNCEFAPCPSPTSTPTPPPTRPGSDTTPPVISNIQPQGTLPASTKEVTITLETNETARCGISQNPGVIDQPDARPFTTTGGTSHSIALPEVEEGKSYTRYARCKDEAGNINPKDSIIQFSIEKLKKASPLASLLPIVIISIIGIGVLFFIVRRLRKK